MQMEDCRVESWKVVLKNGGDEENVEGVAEKLVVIVVEPAEVIVVV